MTLTHFLVGATLGLILGLALLVAGGLQPPAAPNCPTCVILGTAVVHPACPVVVMIQGPTCG